MGSFGLCTAEFVGSQLQMMRMPMVWLPWGWLLACWGPECF